jgi:hypothetical protein
MEIIYKNIREVGNNQGFNNKHFEAKMREVGFVKGHSWCSYFVKHIWKEFEITCKNKDYRNISAGVIKTYNNFRDEIITDLENLNVGSIIIWQSKTDRNKGHTGVFIKQIDSETILTLEGNTNKDGAREGDGVYLKKRKYKNCGFNFLGFIPAGTNEFFNEFIKINIDYSKNYWREIA